MDTSQHPLKDFVSGESSSEKTKNLLSKNQKLEMLCELNCCNLVFIDVEQLHKHIKHHIEAQLEDGHGLLDMCRWVGCGYQNPGGYSYQNSGADGSEMVRHIFFHAFHARLKCIGYKLMEHGALAPCLLGAHTRNVIPELPDRLVCAWEHCGALHDSADFFYKHVSHHADNEDQAKCLWNGCGTTFRNRYKLKEHMRSHTQEKLVACPNCGALFANRTKFSDHLKRQQNRDGADLSSAVVFECSHCYKNFPSERILRDHMRHHVNHYKCTLCDMTCPTPSSLRSHMKYRHTNATPYQCLQCDYAFKREVDLRKHMETHVQNDFFKCTEENCSYVTKTYQSLASHYNRMHAATSGKFECHLCNLTVRRGAFLTKHLQKVHQFKWPSGHTRFRYKQHADGVHRLQMVRYESVELAVIPEDKILQSLNKDGLNLTAVERAPERKRRKATATKTDAKVAKPPRKRKKKPKVMKTETEVGNTNHRTIGDDVGNARVSNANDVVFRAPPNVNQWNQAVINGIQELVSMEPIADHLTEPRSSTQIHALTYSEIDPIGKNGKAETQAYNLQMLGEVALSFNGMFPKHNSDDSPSKNFYSSITSASSSWMDSPAKSSFTTSPWKTSWTDSSLATIEDVDASSGRVSSLPSVETASNKYADSTVENYCLTAFSESSHDFLQNIVQDDAHAVVPRASTQVSTKVTTKVSTQGSLNQSSRSLPPIKLKRLVLPTVLESSIQYNSKRTKKSNTKSCSTVQISANDVEKARRKSPRKCYLPQKYSHHSQFVISPVKRQPHFHMAALSKKS